VFQSDKVSTVNDARQLVEQKFEENFMPERDQVEYLKKQMEYYQTKTTSGIRSVIPPLPKSVPK
jgi:hypothetical protein